MTLTHISYSQFKTYSSCPRQWYLSKVRQGEEKQSWYIPIGTSVHDKVEARLKGEPDRPMEDYFYPIVSKQMRIEPDLSAWLAGGPKDAPIVEELALKRAVDCYEKALQELEDIDVWEVEHNASGRLPGLSVEIKAFVDIIGEHKKKGPVIVDWKTGSTKPDNFQLITYAALLMEGRDFKGYHHLNFQGRYVMLAPGSANTRYVDLSNVNPEEVGKKYQAVVDRINNKNYEAKAGFGCKFCFQADNCLVNAGITPRSAYYDKSADDGYPY
jgi:CRISPR/Cas system-associated exonuclease Cas4 (RecB family)